MVKKLIKIVMRILYTRISLISLPNAPKGLKVNGFSKFTKNTFIAENCNFNGFVVTGLGDVKIGRYFHSGEGCRILTSFHNYEGEAIPYDNTYITKSVVIEDFVWIGVNVIILGGVRISEGAIIQAGSVVVNDIPEYSIAGGHPAKVFSKRDISHFKNLKQAKKFN